MKSKNLFLYPKNRREFLISASAFGGIIALDGCRSRSSSSLLGDSTQKVRTRINLGELEKSDPQNILSNYNFAVGKMNELGSKLNPPVAMLEPRSWYYQANIHNDWCPHNNWFFLPWHRAYLHYFEEVVRSILLEFHPQKNIPEKQNEFQNWSLPYWDWTLYRTKKGSGDFGFPDSFLDTTNFPNLVHRRQIQSPIPPVNSVGEEIMKKILNINDFFTFGSKPAKTQREEAGGGQLESAPHNSIHGWVGGQNADMADYYSPLDPIFWLHHCNVDRLWSTWTELHPTQVLPPISTPSDASLTREFFLNFRVGHFYDPATKQSVSPSIQEVYDKLAVLYAYDDTGFGRIRAAGDQTPKSSATARGFGNPNSGTAEAAQNVATFVHPSITISGKNIRVLKAGSNYSFTIKTVLPPEGDDKGYNLKDAFGVYQKSASKNATIRLVAENVPIEKTKSFSFHVFMKSDQNDETSIAEELKRAEVAKSKHYVGTFSFFVTHADHMAQAGGNPANTMDNKMKFVFDLKQALENIYPKGVLLGEEVKFYVVVRSLGNSREILKEIPYTAADFADIKLTFEYIENTEAGR